MYNSPQSSHPSPQLFRLARNISIARFAAMIPSRYTLTWICFYNCDLNNSNSHAYAHAVNPRFSVLPPKNHYKVSMLNLTPFQRIQCQCLVNPVEHEEKVNARGTSYPYNIQTEPSKPFVVAGLNLLEGCLNQPDHISRFEP